MLEVQKYLKENGIEKLKEEFGIKVREYPENGLLVLNYCQIESPKTHAITRECRGLTLDYDFNVVARSFDRFFNVGEADCLDFDINPNSDVIHEKMDGSLIRIYNHNGRWFLGTRGTAFAEAQVVTGDMFFDLCMKVYEESPFLFHGLCELYLDEDVCYILEFTSAENRVVTRYEGYNLTFLAARNKNGDYVTVPDDVIYLMKWKKTKKYSLDTIQDCIRAASELPDLQEGYVVYRHGVPVCKIKSPLYTACHLIRGEGLSPRRCVELVCTMEYDEYLAYYPEDLHIIQPYIDAIEAIISEVENLMESTKDIGDKKEFAMAIKDSSVKHFLFANRTSGISPRHYLQKISMQGKMSLVQQYMK